MDNNKRALPQIPEPVARSPMFSRSRPGSPSRSPTRSQFSTPSASPVRSPTRSQNPFDSHTINSPSLFHPNTSPTSPVRRLQFSHNDDSDIINVENLSSPIPSSLRPLPQSPGITSPFDDGFENIDIGSSTNLTAGIQRIPSNGSDSTLANSMSQPQKSFGGKDADASYDEDQDIDDFDTDYDGRSIASFETLSDATAPPSEQPRRNKSMSRKQVKLVRGNLVLDCPVPTKLYSFLPRRDSDEYVYMRYSACTADPDLFAESGFTIRPAINKRETEICVCITMYNEDEVLFTRTLHAVFKNIAYLCQRTKSKVWGPNGWKKVVVTIISDGRSKINPRVLDCLAAMGVFQDGVAKNFVNGEEVQSHIFEYTAQVSLTPDLKFQGAEKNIVPVQMIFCLKERNAKKINSHRWLFNALCPQLDPNVIVLLDVGTCPSNATLYHLWKAFDEDSNVAGACGEIKSMVGKFGKSLLNPLVAAQNFEYKMSNILDKPFESVFGYISVLPGALSAYRWRALQNHEDGTGPLASYFKGEKLDSVNAGIFEKNMYLAEDRILCWELVAKRGDKWVLKYVKSAKGITDVPETMPELISQRRRWLNGALFAAVYSLTHFKQIWTTDHSPVRKFFLHVEFLYQLANLIFTFFSIANYFLAFYFLAGSVSGDNSAAFGHGAGLALFLIFKYILIIAIASQFVLSLGNRPQGSKTLFVGTTVMLSLTMTYTMIISLYFVIKTLTEPDGESTGVLVTIVFSLAATYGVYAVMSVLYCDPWHMFTSAIQYFLQLPLYSVTLQIYSICNTHDVTWGTKGDNEQKMDLGAAVVNKIAGTDVVEVEMPSEQVDIDTGYENALHCLREKGPSHEAQPSQATVDQDYFREIRTRVVLVWMTANLLLILLITQFFSLDNPGKNTYLQIVLWSTAAFALMRAAGSFVFLMQYVARKVLKANYHTGVQWRKTMNKVRGKIEPAA